MQSKGPTPPNATWKPPRNSRGPLWSGIMKPTIIPLIRRVWPPPTNSDHQDYETYLGSGIPINLHLPLGILDTRIPTPKDARETASYCVVSVFWGEGSGGCPIFVGLKENMVGKKRMFFLKNNNVKCINTANNKQTSHKNVREKSALSEIPSLFKATGFKRCNPLV